MKIPQLADSERKKLARFLGMTLLSTALSVAMSILATFIVGTVTVKKARLKQTLLELFPDYGWEFTGTHQTLRKVAFTIYYQPGFTSAHPDAEDRLREALVQNSPGLAKMKLELVFLPVEYFSA